MRSSCCHRCSLLACSAAAIAAAWQLTHCDVPSAPSAATAVVEDIGKRREPLPQLVGVYFIAPTDNNVRQLVRDFSLAAMPQYKVRRRL